MKRLLIVLLLLAFISLAAIYIFIPETLHVSKSVYLPTTAKSAVQYLSTSAYWNSWINTADDSSGEARNNFTYQYIPDSVLYSEVKVKIKRPGSIYSSRINVLPAGKDSVVLSWSAELNVGNSPIERLNQYRAAVHLKKEMTEVLERYNNWIGKSQNVYGIPVVRGFIQDSVLVTIRTTFNDYPTDKQVYELLQKLNDHFVKYGAEQTGYPMLNVTKRPDGIFQVQVAIPINKDVAETPNIVMKHMVLGYALTSEIRGGYFTIENGLKAMEQYRVDYDMRSPAIAFQSIITNRMIETDTTKWITKLYFPIY
ncbi:MAG: hypothetical protein V4717_12485 [Bacteroidota bacterium]